jgi:uncharacterized protein YigA (DUF484 family)
MTQQITNETPDKELSWEEAVARYLEDHPDFLQRRTDVLARLNLEHDTGGRAVSLIERQVQALRGHEQELKRELRGLVAVARENDVLGNRLHRLALALVEATSPDEALDATVELLRTEFRLEAAAVRAVAAPSLVGTRPEYVSPDDRRLTMLLRQFSAGKPICGATHDESLLAFLFGDARRELRSTALVPLGGKDARGVLALGSHDPHRFHAGMGTVYLTRLGELLGAALRRVTAGA